MSLTKHGITVRVEVTVFDDRFPEQRGKLKSETRYWAREDQFDFDPSRPLQDIADVVGLQAKTDVQMMLKVPTRPQDGGPPVLPPADPRIVGKL